MTAKAQDITNTDDIIDIRDVIARFEELENVENISDAEQEEKEKLEKLLKTCAGNGGDEQWRGDWYPVTLIHESYFENYAQEMAEDIGAIDPKATWPLNHIDWEAAAEELQNDYTQIDFDGETYFTR